MLRSWTCACVLLELSTGSHGFSIHAHTGAAATDYLACCRFFFCSISRDYSSFRSPAACFLSRLDRGRIFPPASVDFAVASIFHTCLVNIGLCFVSPSSPQSRTTSSLHGHRQPGRQRRACHQLPGVPVPHQPGREAAPACGQVYSLQRGHGEPGGRPVLLADAGAASTNQFSKMHVDFLWPARIFLQETNMAGL